MLSEEFKDVANNRIELKSSRHVEDNFGLSCKYYECFRKVYAIWGPGSDEFMSATVELGKD